MSSAVVLVNGTAPVNAGQAVAVSDRGLNYGDGLFETALLRNGAVRFWDAHLARLQLGCERLEMAFPGTELSNDLLTMERLGWGGSHGAADGVLKVVVTRGVGGRGYRPTPGLAVTRIVSLHSLPAADGPQIAARWCSMRLSRNPALAGMKHLNRLEQIFAQREWEDGSIAEGLMLDTEGELVGGTASNVFMVRDATLLTPDLKFCGVRGVMREQVLKAAAGLGIPCSEEPLWPHDLESASEVFVTNAVRGIRSIVTLESGQLGAGQRKAGQWRAGPVAQRLIAMLGL